MVPRLDIKHLAVMLAVCETGSVTRAGARLGLTQSAVTHRIREAERRLGCQLFARAGKQLVATPAGERLLGVATRVVDQLSRFEEEIGLLNGSARKLVRMGQATYSRFHWLPAFLGNFENVAPDIEVDLVARATRAPFSALREGAVDVAIIYGSRTTSASLRWFHLAADPLVVVMAPGHRLANNDWIDAEDLAEERYFAYPLTSEPGFEWETVLGPPSVTFRRVSQVQLPEAVIDLVRGGFGVSILSRWAVEPEVHDATLVAKPLTRTGVTLDWWAVIRDTEEKGSPAWTLAEALVNWSRRAEGGLDTLAFKPHSDAGH